MKSRESHPVRFDFVSTFSDKHGAAIGESLGPEAVAGHLQAEFQDGVRVNHYDLQLDSLKKIVAQIIKDQPDIIGLSIKIGSLNQTDELLAELARAPFTTRPLIVLGGVVPTFATKELLERYPSVILATGEGEVASQMLVEAVRENRSLEGIPGITYINPDGEIISSAAQLWPQSKLHLPARLTTQRIHQELRGMIWAEDSRGCDHNCTFCSRRSLRGSGFSGDMPPQRVVDDLENLNRLGIYQVSFSGDDFGGDPERTFLIAEEIIRRGIKMEWSVSTRADHVYERKNTPEQNVRLREIMQRCAQAGLVRVFLGLESGSQSQLKRYGKQITVEENYRAIEILRELNIDVVAGYIPIDYLMTVTELRETLEFLENTGMGLKVSNPLSILRVQAGSPYVKLMKNAGLLGEKTEDLVFYHAQFKDPRIELIAQLADRWVTDIYPFIFGLKGEVATATLNRSRIDDPLSSVETTLQVFRRLELEFLKSLVTTLEKIEKIDHFQIATLERHFVQKRLALLNEVRRRLKKRAYGPEASARLLSALEKTVSTR